MTQAFRSNTELLIRARKRDSEIKRKRALETVQRMLDAGQRVRFTTVARQAGVSTWLLYSVQELKDAVECAIALQARQPSTSRSAESVLPESISATDLALARQEIKDLRAENKKLTARLRSTLGAELDVVDRHQLIDRIHELERAVQVACEARDEAGAAAQHLSARVAELEEEVAVLETLNQNYIREINRSRRKQ